MQNFILAAIEKYIAAHPEILEKLAEVLIQRLLDKIASDLAPKTAVAA